jgi:hypothetical protein
MEGVDMKYIRCQKPNTMHIFIFLVFLLSLSFNKISAQEPEFLWALGAGGSDTYDIGRCITTDNSGNVIVTGQFYGTISFDTITFTSPGAYGYRDIFIVKLDQSGNILWAQQAGGNGNDYCYSITTDGSDNIIITGMFWNNAKFGDTWLRSADSQWDIYIAKYDPSGNLLWVKRDGNPEHMGDKQSVTTDELNNIIITGYFVGTAIFGTTNLESVGDWDIYISKYDGLGNLLWAKRDGGADREDVYGITSDKSSNIIITGYFTNSTTFGTTELLSAGGNDVFIVKYDQSGNNLWAIKAGGESVDEGHAVVTDSDDNVIATGRFSNTATFGGIPLGKHAQSFIFVVKFDPFGEIVWAKQAGDTTSYGNMYDGNSIDTDIYNNIIIAGYFVGTAIIGTNTLNSAGGGDIFIVKYSPSGHVLWAKRAGGIYYDVCQSVTSYDTDNIFITGYFSDTVNFGTTTLISSGNRDMFAAKLTNPPGSADQVPPVWNSTIGLQDVFQVEDGTVRLYWNKAIDIESSPVKYNIYFNEIVDGTPVSTASILDLNAVNSNLASNYDFEYTIDGLKEGSQYSFELKAEDSATSPNETNDIGYSKTLDILDFMTIYEIDTELGINPESIVGKKIIIEGMGLNYVGSLWKEAIQVALFLVDLKTLSSGKFVEYFAGQTLNIAGLNPTNFFLNWLKERTSYQVIVGTNTLEEFPSHLVVSPVSIDPLKKIPKGEPFVAEAKVIEKHVFGENHRTIQIENYHINHNRYDFLPHGFNQPEYQLYNFDHLNDDINYNIIGVKGALIGEISACWKAGSEIIFMLYNLRNTDEKSKSIFIKIPSTTDPLPMVHSVVGIYGTVGTYMGNHSINTTKDGIHLIVGHNAPVAESEFINRDNLISAVYSPVDLHLYDSQGNHTGAIYDLNGNVIGIEENISNSNYIGPDSHPELIILTQPLPDNYMYKIVGTDNGTYTLSHSFITNMDSIIFNQEFNSVPIDSGQVYQNFILYDTTETGGSQVGLADTLAPYRPENVVATQFDFKVQLTWELNQDDDVMSFAIFSDIKSGFVPSDSSLIGISSVNDYITNELDENITYYFLITAVDSSGNISEYSDEVSILIKSSVGVDKEKVISKSFYLFDPYPNPFNPSTSIRFILPKLCFVSLKVYDVLGKEVETLINTQKQAGEYTIKWEPRKLSSGLFFYRLHAGEFMETKKVVIQK